MQVQVPLLPFKLNTSHKATNLLTASPCKNTGDPACQLKKMTSNTHRVLPSALRPTLRPASHSYGHTSFQSDHHEVLCWLLEYMSIPVWFQLSNECNLSQLTSSRIPCQHRMCTIFSSSVKLSFGIHRPFALLLSFSVCAKTWQLHLRLFAQKCYLWCSDWLKLLGWLTAHLLSSAEDEFKLCVACSCE